MFGLNVRFQTAAFLFVILILVDFFRSKKIPTAANKNFRIMLFMTVINMFFDITTVYTITHMDTVSNTVNVLAHRGFYISIALVVQSFYRYVDSLDSDKCSENRTIVLLKKLPFFLAVICSAFLDIWFVCDNERYAYSQGSAVIALFICAGIQFVLIIIDTLKSRISKDTKGMILLGVGIWIGVCFVQYFLPHLLLTGLGIAMMVLVVYLSFENPAEYVDREMGCYNRFAFDSVLQERMLSSRPFVIINVVIDKLGTIISRFGYDSGHKLMKEIGEFLSGCGGGLVYIFGFNSFALFTDDRDRAEKICGEISRRLDKMWTVGGCSMMVKGHCDILEFPDHAHNSGEVNHALSFAAEHASPDITVNLIGDDMVNAYKREAMILDMLKEAVKNDGFEVYYQPVYNASEGRFSSAEALVRLTNCGLLQYVSPMEFIPIAEKNGIVTRIGSIVFKMVCRYIRENDLPSKGIDSVSVNLSGVQTVNTELVEMIKNEMERSKIPPSYINLEISERVPFASLIVMQNTLRSLYDMGCGIVLDNFGTGETCLARLGDYGFDRVKLDRQLIMNCFDEEKTAARRERSKEILISLIRMLNALGFEVTAVGAETAEQAELLVSHGVSNIQGSYYSRPLSGEELIMLLAENTVKNERSEA